jgi:hypothetical protein
LLVKGANSENLVIAQCEEGKIAFQIDVCAPVVNGGTLGNAVLNEKKFARRDRGEKVE